jgi:hypothetical protein
MEVRAMKNLQLPESFVKLFFMLRDNFTKPSFQHFEVLLAAILLGHPKKTVTSGLRLLKPDRHFSSACRFLSQYKWDAIQLGLLSLGLILKYLPVEAPLLFALDDTLVPKYGAKIFGRGIHYDHANKPNRPRYIHGHNWVVIGLLHYSSLFSKWLCFPILADLFVPVKNLTSNQPFKTRIQLAVELLTHIKAYVQKKLIVIADGLYAKTILVRYAISENITMISRLRSDAALFQKPQKVTTRKRGRPRKYGARLSLNKLSKQQDQFNQHTLKLYGENHQLRIRALQALWKPAGEIIKVVIVYFDQNKKPGYFFSTDLAVSDTQIVEWIAARWSIETLFDDFKEHLGMTDWQCRIQKSVVRSVPLTCVATSLLIIWSVQQFKQNNVELWDVYPWYRNKASPCIRDMIQQLKAKCISKTIIDALPKKAITKKKYQQLELFLRFAA